MSVANIGMLQEPFRKRKWCLRDFADTQEGLRNHFAAKSYSRRAAKLASTLMFSASSLRHISGNFRRKYTLLYKKAAKSLRNKRVISQQKGDFATLCKMLPSAWSDWLAMAATSSFQLRITHCLKHWIVDFLRFEMVYNMHQLDSRKCSKSGCYDCYQEYASWQILFTFSPCIPDLLLANDFQALPKIPHNSPQS
uniref:Uncharacterized protein n=1 Tax=Vitis vinifera TaxID=29760 RepID=A5BFP9_VITVI|nr:hypothetical protein VITISV_013918 [Vitis vinifera]